MKNDIFNNKKISFPFFYSVSSSQMSKQLMQRDYSRLSPEREKERVSTREDEEKWRTREFFRPKQSLPDAASMQSGKSADNQTTRQRQQSRLVCVCGRMFEISMQGWKGSVSVCVSDWGEQKEMEAHASPSKLKFWQIVKEEEFRQVSRLKALLR